MEGARAKRHPPDQLWHGQGDSVIGRHAPMCAHVRECRTLRQIADFIQSLASADELMAADAINHGPGSPPVPGTDGIKLQAALLRTAIPNLRVTLNDQFGHDDRVVSRWTGSGNHGGYRTGSHSFSNSACCPRRPCRRQPRRLKTAPARGVSAPNAGPRRSWRSADAARRRSSRSATTARPSGTPTSGSR